MNASDWLSVGAFAARSQFWRACSYSSLVATGWVVFGAGGAPLLFVAGLPIAQAMVKEVMPLARSRRYYGRARVYAWSVLSLCSVSSCLLSSSGFILLIPATVYWDRLFSRRIRDIDLDLVRDVMGS